MDFSDDAVKIYFNPNAFSMKYHASSTFKDF